MGLHLMPFLSDISLMIVFDLAGDFLMIIVCEREENLGN